MSDYAGIITSLIDNLGSGMMRGDSPAEVPRLSPSAAREYLLPNCAYCARLGVSTFH